MVFSPLSYDIINNYFDRFPNSQPFFYSWIKTFLVTMYYPFDTLWDCIWQYKVYFTYHIIHHFKYIIQWFLVNLPSCTTITIKQFWNIFIIPIRSCLFTVNLCSHLLSQVPICLYRFAFFRCFIYIELYMVSCVLLFHLACFEVHSPVYHVSVPHFFFALNNSPHVDTLHFIYLITNWWTLRLFPTFGHYD